MSKLEELKEIISEGKSLLETKITTYESTPDYNRGSLRHDSTIEINNIDETQYQKWKAKVVSFLNNNNLTALNEVNGWTVYGNCAFVEPQVNKLENLYGLCQTLKNDDINFVASYEEIEKSILLLLNFDKQTYLDQLEIYYLVIGKDNFFEVCKTFDTLDFTNIIIKFGFNGIRFYLPENNYLTLKGKKRYEEIIKKEMSRTTQAAINSKIEVTTEKTQNPTKKTNWGLVVAWIGSIGTIFAVFWEIYTYYVPVNDDNQSTIINTNQQAAPVNVIGSGNNVIIQQNQN